MPQALFGSGQVIFTPPSTDADPTPIRLATLQEVTLDSAGTTKELYGANQMPEMVGVSERKITGKAKYGKFEGRQLYRFFQGATMATGSKSFVVETGQVVTGAYTAVGTATYADDLGVVAADGTIYKKVASNPTGAQYTVTSAGVFGFNTTENNKYLIFRYTKTVVMGNTVTLVNGPMALAQVFKMFLFIGDGNLGAELLAVTFPKFSVPFKNTDFGVPDIDFTAWDDGTGKAGYFYTKD